MNTAGPIQPTMSGVALSDGSLAKLCYDYVIPTAISTVCHPFVCARTLMMVIAFFSIHSAFYSWVMSLSRPRSEGTLLDCGDTCIRMFLTIVCVFLQITKFLVGHLREDVGLFPIFTVGLPASIIGSAIKSSVCESYLRVSCMWAFFLT